MIIAYFIESLHEYQHAIGRVNRNENKSTFIEIFCEDELRSVGLDRNASKDDLSRVRKEIFTKDIELCHQKLTHSEKMHTQTVRGYIDPELNQ